MIYTHRKTHSSNIFSNWKLPITVLVVLGVIVFIFRYSIINLFPAVFNNGTNISGITESKKSLTTKNSTLQQQVVELQAQIAENALLRTDNESLRSLLKYTKNPEQLITTAAVLSNPKASVLGQIIINQGINAGINAGDLIVVGDHVLLGTVEKVYEKTAAVNMYSSSGFHNENGFVIKNLGIRVDGKGNGNGNFNLQVPNTLQVVDGDVIILPQYPERVVGVIKSIESDPRDPFQKVIARTPININELKFVQVIRP